MAIVSTREQLKAYVLRDLGFPLIQVDVADEQLEDRIDEAIQFFQEYYWDGIVKTYFKYTLNSTDKANGYIPVPDHIYAVTALMAPGGSMLNFTSPEYQATQAAAQNLYSFTESSLMYFEQVMSHIDLIQNRLVPDRNFQFNRLEGKLRLDSAIERIPDNTILVFEAYAALNPNDAPKFWNERMFKEYCCALVKLQWAQNLSKYQGVQLPGGVTINSAQMRSDAEASIDKIENNIMDSLSPMSFFIG